MASGPSKLRAFGYEAVAWMVRETLERNGWNVRAAAVELGVKRQGLYRIAARVGVKIVRSERQARVPGPL
jgi:transcriptional regulator of acetoin/glycerol metabolism